MFVKLLNAQNARRLVVIVEVEIGGVELPVLQDNEYEVVRVELTQVLSTSIVIKALYIMVKPNSSTAEGRSTMRLERNLMNVNSGEQVASALTPFD